MRSRFSFEEANFKRTTIEMKLYHGTSYPAGRMAIIEGLKPRKDLKHKGNWQHTVDSRRDAVYLTTVYAPYFALCASERGMAAVVEVETDRLFQCNLVPDEDAIEQTNRKTGELPEHWSIEQRTKHYRKSLHEYNCGQWEDSIKALGTCAYIGRIPKSAITRVAFFNPADHKRWVGTSMDPTISVLNYRFMREKYQVLTSVLFNDPYSPEPEQELQIKAQLHGQLGGQAYHNAWDIAKEFDHSKVEIVTVTNQRGA